MPLSLKICCFFAFLALHLCGFYPLTAQNQLHTHSSKATKLYNNGTEALASRNLKLAQSSFEEALVKDSVFPEAHFQLALMYRTFLRNQAKALYHLQKVAVTDYHPPGLYKMLGEAEYLNGDYERAVNYLTQSLREPQSKLQEEETRRHLENCRFALEAMQHPLPYNPVKLATPLNNMDMQYFPVLTADQQFLVFTGRNHKENNEDMFVSRRQGSGWSEPIPISDNINTPYFNEGTCSISADGKVLVFTRCGNERSRDGNCDLFISYKQGDRWTKPENMGNKVNSPSWDSQPTLSADGKILYFSSRRAGGYGNEDIWMCKADRDGNWDFPVNLGDLINTQGREVSPFIHPSQSSLYFASDYHTGLGSFDLFVSNWDEMNWGEPHNLGYPVNTYLDESSIFVTADGKKGYYSAQFHNDLSRKERYFMYNFDLPREISSRRLSTYAKGTVYDAKTKLPIEADVELISLRSGKTESMLKSDVANGSYLVVLTEGSEYALYVNKQGYLFNSHSFNYINEKSFNPLSLDVYLEPIRPGATITLNNLFFATGKYELEDKSRIELDRVISFLHLHPQLKVEISGHTDNVGAKAQNILLSERRAKAVFNYLITNDLDSDRIRHKGYGDVRPVAPNDSEENRQQNRRIEFRIL